MKSAAAKPTTHSSSSEATLGASAVVLTFLDTTWRIAIPVVAFTVLGIAIDLHVGTKPWLTFLGVIVGFALAIALVKRQLAAVQKAEDK